MNALYYEFAVKVLMLFIVIYGIGAWKTYFQDKQREKTLREAMRN